MELKQSYQLIHSHQNKEGVDTMGKSKKKELDSGVTMVAGDTAYTFSKKELIGAVSFIFLLIVGVAILSSIFVITYPNRYSVVKQFGEIVKVVEQPGLSFKVPFVQKVTPINKDLMFYDIATSDVITKDKKTMIVDAYVLWRVTDPVAYTRQLGGSNSTAEQRLNSVVYNALKTTISSMTQDEVILSRDGKINVSNFAEDIITDDIEVNDEDGDGYVEIKSLTEEINVNLRDCSDYGIEIVETRVKVLDLPDANKDAVYNRMISERNNVAAGYEAQGDSEAQIIINTTDKEISIMKSNARAEAEKIKAEGEAEYMRILSDAYNSPEKSEFYDFVRSLESAQKSLKKGVLVLEKDSPLANLFYK